MSLSVLENFMYTWHFTGMAKHNVAYQAAINEIEASRSEIESQHISVVKVINSSIRELHEMLDCRKQELLDMALELVEVKLSRLNHQRAELESSMSIKQRKAANEKSIVVTATNGGLVEQCDQTNYHLPVEEADITVEMRCAEELRHLCQKMKIVTSPIDPFKCIVDGIESDLKNIEVAHPIKLKLQAYSMSGKPQRKSVHVEATLRSCIDNSIVQASVEKVQGSNTYNIECTPLVRGQHQLEVTVNSLPVAKSPFSLVVKCQPMQLGEPLQVIDGLKGPTGIAFNSADELVVAEFNGGIAILDKDRKIVRRIDRHGSGYDLEEPWGVAIDNEDNIYVTDQDNRKIYKFNKQLELVTHSMVQQEKCFGIAIIGERVIVIEKWCERLEVFTRDLDFMKMIETTRIQGCSLAFDGDSKLYICDAVSHRIHVLSDQGKCLDSIGDKPGLGLQTPHFVCIDGNLVYVTEYKGHCVSVFTTSGKFLTSFGSAGSGRGQFDHPYGIAFDRNGFLYVSDRLNNRLQIF